MQLLDLVIQGVAGEAVGFALSVDVLPTARAEGLKITTDMYTYTAGATGLDAAMPTWVQAGGSRSGSSG